MPVFKATLDQIHAAPHLRLLIRGGVVERNIDDTGSTGDECYFYDTWRKQHNGIVQRAMRLDEQLVREVQCTKCIEKYGPCDVAGCFFNKMGAQ